MVNMTIGLILIGIVAGAILGHLTFGPRPGTRRGNVSTPRPGPIAEMPPPSIPPNPASPRPPRGGSGQANGCTCTCRDTGHHPPTTGRWLRPDHIKSVDVHRNEENQ